MKRIIGKKDYQKIYAWNDTEKVLSIISLKKIITYPALPKFYFYIKKGSRKQFPIYELRAYESVDDGTLC